MRAGVEQAATRGSLAAAVLGTGLAWSAATAAPPGVHVAFQQVPVGRTASATPTIADTVLSDRYRMNARVMLADLADFERSLVTVEDSFVFTGDPVFRHDGQRFLFTGLATEGATLGIYERGIDDDAARPVTFTESDCVAPAYAPNGGVIFASPAAGEYEEHGGLRSLSLYALAPGADSPTRLTYNPSSDFEPSVLPDGRIAYSSWQHVGNHFWPRGIVALMLINSDGTGVFPLTGNHREPWMKRGIAPFGRDGVAFVTGEPESLFHSGALVATSLNDLFSEYRTLLAADEYLVERAAALPGGGFVVSARPAGDVRATFGLYVLDQSGAMRLLYDDPAWHEIAPSVASERPRDEPRSSTVVPGTPYGYLLVLNCYETDRPNRSRLRPGGVETVRVLEGLPLRDTSGRAPDFIKVEGRGDEPLAHPDGGTGYIPTRILGEVAPEEDGSIYLKVPADRPLRLQLVDDEGFAVVNERAWFWVRPNERRVCIGCHENRELSPPNAVAAAARKPPADLTDPDKWRTVTFRQDVEPMLQRDCALSGCHVPPRPTAAMNLTRDELNGNSDAPLAERYGPAYANLLARQKGKPFSVGGRRVHPGDSRRSPLLWMLHGRALAPQYRAAPFERPLLDPHPDDPLEPWQMQIIRTWIDLGALYDCGAVPCEGPPAITMNKGAESDVNERQ